MRNFLIALIVISTLISSCKKDDGSPQETSITTLNVSYGTNTQQKMDVYLPANRNTATTKVIIMIHGGGWNAGDKSDFTAYVDSLKKREPSYAPDLFPTQEMDVKAAVEFIYNKRTEYMISDKFVLVGASAGGHLALLQGYKYSTPFKPKAIIDFFGPTELVAMYNNPPNPLVPLLLFSVTGHTPTTNNTLYTQSSPVNFITSQSPPTMILHGGVDIVVSPSQSVLLSTKLITAGVTQQYVFYPTENHGWVGANLSDSFNKIQAFLAANVQ
jgi:acetyl esterase/lipase